MPTVYGGGGSSGGVSLQIINAPNADTVTTAAEPTTSAAAVTATISTPAMFTPQSSGVDFRHGSLGTGATSNTFSNIYGHLATLYEPQHAAQQDEHGASRGSSTDPISHGSTGITTPNSKGLIVLSQPKEFSFPITLEIAYRLKGELTALDTETPHPILGLVFHHLHVGTTGLGMAGGHGTNSHFHYSIMDIINGALGTRRIGLHTNAYASIDPTTNQQHAHNRADVTTASSNINLDNSTLHLVVSISDSQLRFYVNGEDVTDPDANSAAWIMNSGRALESGDLLTNVRTYIGATEKLDTGTEEVQYFRQFPFEADTAFVKHLYERYLLPDADFIVHPTIGITGTVEKVDTLQTLITDSNMTTKLDAITGLTEGALEFDGKSLTTADGRLAIVHDLHEHHKSQMNALFTLSSLDDVLPDFFSYEGDSLDPTVSTINLPNGTTLQDDDTPSTLDVTVADVLKGLDTHVNGTSGLKATVVKVASVVDFPLNRPDPYGGAIDGFQRYLTTFYEPTFTRVRSADAHMWGWNFVRYGGYNFDATDTQPKTNPLEWATYDSSANQSNVPLVARTLAGVGGAPDLVTDVVDPVWVNGIGITTSSTSGLKITPTDHHAGFGYMIEMIVKLPSNSNGAMLLGNANYATGYDGETWTDSISHIHDAMRFGLFENPVMPVSGTRFWFGAQHSYDDVNGTPLFRDQYSIPIAMYLLQEAEAHIILSVDFAGRAEVCLNGTKYTMTPSSGATATVVPFRADNWYVGRSPYGNTVANTPLSGFTVRAVNFSNLNYMLGDGYGESRYKAYQRAKTEDTSAVAAAA